MHGYLEYSAEPKALALCQAYPKAMAEGLKSATKTRRHLDNLKLLKGIIMKKTYREIAVELGCKPSIVAGRVFRMRQENSPYAEFIPPAGHLSSEDISDRNSRKKSAKVNMQMPDKSPGTNFFSRSIAKPSNAPKTFLELKQYECSWAVDSPDREGCKETLCCAAEVMDPTKREGDRRSSHCPYHYALSIAPKAAESRKRHD